MTNKKRNIDLDWEHPKVAGTGVYSCSLRLKDKKNGDVYVAQIPNYSSDWTRKEWIARKKRAKDISDRVRALNIPGIIIPKNY